MTTTMGETDLTVLETNDFDIACEVNRHRDNPCDRSAEWVIYLSCCGRPMLLCDPHFQSLLESLGKYIFIDDKSYGGCGRDDIEQPIAHAERLDKTH